MLDKMTKKINKRMSDIFYNDFYTIIKKQINYLHSRVFGKEPINISSEINFLLTLKQKKALLYKYNDDFKNYNEDKYNNYFDFVIDREIYKCKKCLNLIY